MPNIYPIVLAGSDRPTDDWIFVRGLYPSALSGVGDGTELSFFQATCRRASELKNALEFGDVTVVCNEVNLIAAEQQLAQIGVTPRSIVAKSPQATTESAILPLMQVIVGDNADAVSVFLPASHVVDEPEKFLATLKLATDLAAEKRLIFLVVSPSMNKSTRGYARKGKKLKSTQPPLFALESTAGLLVKTEGSYYFGRPGFFSYSGISVCHGRTFIGNYQQAMAKHSSAIAKEDDGSQTAKDLSFDVCLAQSAEASLLVLDTGWMDASRLPEFIEAFSVPKFGHANPAVNIRQLIDSPEVVVVASTKNLENVVDIVRQARARETQIISIKSRTTCSWGYSDWLATGERYRIKLMEVEPASCFGSRLHRHRAEHWIVRADAARVTREQASDVVHENEVIYIAPSSMHALENPGRIPLVRLEVQWGRLPGR